MTQKMRNKKFVATIVSLLALSMLAVVLLVSGVFGNAGNLIGDDRGQSDLSSDSSTRAGLHNVRFSTNLKESTTVDLNGVVDYSVSVTMNESPILKLVVNYQWYDLTNGTKIMPGEINANFKPKTNVAGTFRYYVKVEYRVVQPMGFLELLQDFGELSSNTAVLTVNQSFKKPVITSQPKSVTIDNISQTTLSVVANSPDGHELGYQWKMRDASSFSTVTTAITGATSNSYTFIPSKVGKFVFMVEVSIKVNAGTKITSNEATVTVQEFITDLNPSISTHPKAENVTKYKQSLQLSVAATSKKGTLSYNWYSNATNSNLGGTPIKGATGNKFNVPTDNIGEYWYFAEVVNTVDGVAFRVRSKVAKVVVNRPDDKPATIVEQPKANVQVDQGQPLTLDVAAKASVGGVLRYQWHKIEESLGIGVPIANATNTSYSVSTTIIGKFKFFVKVIQTLDGFDHEIDSTLSNVLVVKPDIGGGDTDGGGDGIGGGGDAGIGGGGDGIGGGGIGGGGIGGGDGIGGGGDAGIGGGGDGVDPMQNNNGYQKYLPWTIAGCIVVAAMLGVVVIFLKKSNKGYAMTRHGNGGAGYGSSQNFNEHRQGNMMPRGNGGRPNGRPNGRPTGGSTANKYLKK